jgi:hypothetical protein
MSANTSFATTTSTLTQFIAKQRITNSTFTEDLSSTEYPLTAVLPLKKQRYDDQRITTLIILPANAGSDGYLTQSDWNSFSSKLSSITAGQNIITTTGTSPSVSLSISSLIDMSNFQIKNISFQDFKQNIDIRQANTQRIYTTPTQMVIAPNGNLSIQSDISLNGKTLDMTGGIIRDICNQDFRDNINIKQGGVSRIFTTGLDMEIVPDGILKIRRAVNLNANNLDMNDGLISNIKYANFMTEVDIQRNGNQIIYTNTLPTTLNIAAPTGGFINVFADISMNANKLNMGSGTLNMGGGTLNMGTGGTLNMGGGAITNLLSEDFTTNIDIKQGGTSRIYTNTGPTKLNINAPGFLNILTDISMNANRLNMGSGTLNMGGGTLNMGTGGTLNLTGAALNIGGGTLNMAGGAITNLLSEDFNTNIDIKQGGTSRIYTTPTQMIIAPNGNLSILSDISMNGKTLDMTGGIIRDVCNQDFRTNINIKQNGTSLIYTNTAPVKLNIDAPATGFINVLADISMNANRLNMGSGILDMSGGIVNMGGGSTIYTTGQNMSIDSFGTLSILSDLSMNANNIKDISGIYALSSKNLLIDASSVTFKNTSAQTHMVIDNCGMILNDISSSQTGTVLSYNKTNGRVHYDSLYDSSINGMKLDGGGALSANYNIKIHRIADTITLSIPDASCVIANIGTIYSIAFDKNLDTTYRPSNDVNFVAAVYDNSNVYTTGKVKVSSGGIISIYNDISQNTTVWTNNRQAGIESQCFTYIRG